VSRSAGAGGLVQPADTPNSIPTAAVTSMQDAPDGDPAGTLDNRRSAYTRGERAERHQADQRHGRHTIRSLR
jgi:hypothetical protein